MRYLVNCGLEVEAQEQEDAGFGADMRGSYGAAAGGSSLKKVKVDSEEAKVLAPERLSVSLEQVKISWSAETHGEDHHLGGLDFKRTELRGVLKAMDVAKAMNVAGDEDEDGYVEIGEVRATLVNKTFIVNNGVSLFEVLDETKEVCDTLWPLLDDRVSIVLPIELKQRNHEEAKEGNGDACAAYFRIESDGLDARARFLNNYEMEAEGQSSAGAADDDPPSTPLWKTRRSKATACLLRSCTWPPSVAAMTWACL